MPTYAYPSRTVRDAEVPLLEAGVPLMARAAAALARFCAEVLRAERGLVTGSRVCVLAGPGNNAGDALHAARRWPAWVPVSASSSSSAPPTATGSPRRCAPAPTSSTSTAGRTRPNGPPRSPNSPAPGSSSTASSAPAVDAAAPARRPPHPRLAGVRVRGHRRRRRHALGPRSRLGGPRVPDPR